MIISATRIRTSSGAGPVLNHVLRGDGNDAISVICGTEADVTDMVATARHAAAQYAIRHYVIAPAEQIGDLEAFDLLGDLATEFGFDPAAALLVRHDKARAATRLARRTGKPLLPEAERADVHWHALVGEVDPVTLRVLDSRHWRARHEKVARLAELRLGHGVVQGRWNRAVLDHLDRGSTEERRLADRLVAAGLRERVRPRAAYTSDQRRRLERSRHDHRSAPLDLPLLIHQLRQAWDQPSLRTGAELQHALKSLGLRIAVVPNDAVTKPRPPRLVIEAWDRVAREPYVLGTLQRLLREPPPRVEARLGALALDPPIAGILPDRAADPRQAPAPPPAPRIPSRHPGTPRPAAGRTPPALRSDVGGTVVPGGPTLPTGR